MMKKLLVTILVLALLAPLSLETYASEHEYLSDMSESECIEFIKQYGVEIPSDYDEATWGPFVKKIIRLVEENPDHQFTYNYTVTLAFANAIKDAVNQHYNVSTGETAMYTASESTTYVLTHSVAIGPWIPEYGLYNCYIYAIGIPQTIFVDPGNYSKQTFSLSLSVRDMADIAIADLQALGHQRVTRDGIDTSNLCDNEQIICLRKGPDDYHFMRFNSGDWYHKPGGTAILKYNYQPSLMRIWTNECLDNEGPKAPTREYTSEIIFISFNGHDWDYAKNYNGTHTKSCDICGDVFVKDCDLEYTYTSLNCHKSVCSDCGHTVTGIACDLAYTYTGDGTSTHTHSGTCQDCGHVSTGTCSFAFSYCGTNNGTHQHINTCTVCGETKGSAMACTYLSGSNNCRICGHNKNAIVTALGLPEDTYTYVNE